VGRSTTCPSSADDVRLAIVVDTREKAPYEFDPAWVRTVRKALPAGDYSLVGREEDVAIERKTLDDYVNSIITHWGRFRRVVQKLGGYRMGCIVVEAALEDVEGRRYRSAVHPNAVLGRTQAIASAYHVPVYFLGTRPLARRFVLDQLRQHHEREHQH